MIVDADYIIHSNTTVNAAWHTCSCFLFIYSFIYLLLFIYYYLFIYLFIFIFIFFFWGGGRNSIRLPMISILHTTFSCLEISMWNFMLVYEYFAAASEAKVMLEDSC